MVCLVVEFIPPSSGIFSAFELSPFLRNGRFTFDEFCYSSSALSIEVRPVETYTLQSGLAILNQRIECTVMYRLQLYWTFFNSCFVVKDEFRHCTCSMSGTVKKTAMVVAASMHRNGSTFSKSAFDGTLLGQRKIISHGSGIVNRASARTYGPLE